MMKAQDSLPDIQKLTGLPLEELMNMSVVSSAGSSQKTIDASSTRNVITANRLKKGV